MKLKNGQNIGTKDLRDFSPTQRISLHAAKECYPGRPLDDLSENEWRRLRGVGSAMICKLIEKGWIGALEQPLKLKTKAAPEELERRKKERRISRIAEMIETSIATIERKRNEIRAWKSERRELEKALNVQA